MDISEYVSDSKQYRTDDDEDHEQIEIYEGGSNDEDGKLAKNLNIYLNSHCSITNLIK